MRQEKFSGDAKPTLQNVTLSLAGWVQGGREGGEGKSGKRERERQEEAHGEERVGGMSWAWEKCCMYCLYIARGCFV